LRPTAIQRAKLYPQGRRGLSSPWSAAGRADQMFSLPFAEFVDHEPDIDLVRLDAASDQDT
jgi:hypothetical protein